ncbi:putative phosphatase [Gordonia araii NBRC 100433]|uniref:Putative phosphatase n=1 Tax=Gordonia araii NBRC 100433 TaxID=1073574 RepID=G7H0X9_9ACTN|nr:metallophosphoesterase [Gordonia araii]NNG97300.1 phosphoesterase [Gordonia araii NBRC 100433]GAB09504.1 putative phosphatase [Gordonia araii NBRC 100433]
MIDNSPESSTPSVNRRTFVTGAAAAAGGIAVAGPAVSAAPAVGAARYPLPRGTTSLRVLVTGDAGTGKPPQYAVAAAARALHADRPFDIAVGLGDNIYESGPSGPDDAQFRAKFERPNAGLDFPWLMALGNHDTTAIYPGDGGWLLRGDVEVQYHRRSRRWYMPSRYYSVDLGVAQFVVLDLNPLAAYIPPVLSPEWEPGGTYMSRQAAWLARSLRESKAPWKFVCTHHPYANNGPHGPAGAYDSLPAPLNGVHLKDFVERHVAGRAQFLLSGHDHSQQVLDRVAGLRGTRQIVSGAAAKSVSKSSSKQFRARYENYRSRGFMTLDIEPGSVLLNAYEIGADRGSRLAFSTTYKR